MARTIVPDRLLTPEKLYGREQETAAIVAAFDRVVRQGGNEWLLVSGYSGIGKSLIIHKLPWVFGRTAGLFATGKFDQFKCNIPHATLAQAFQGVIRQILGKDDGDATVGGRRFKPPLAATAS